MMGMPTKMMMGRNRIRATGGPGEGGCLGEGGGGLVQNAVSLSSFCAAGPRRPVLGGSLPGLSPRAGGRAWGVSPAPSRLLHSNASAIALPVWPIVLSLCPACLPCPSSHSVTELSRSLAWAALGPLCPLAVPAPRCHVAPPSTCCSPLGI